MNIPIKVDVSTEISEALCLEMPVDECGQEQYVSIPINSLTEKQVEQYLKEYGKLFRERWSDLRADAECEGA